MIWYHVWYLLLEIVQKMDFLQWTYEVLALGWNIPSLTDISLRYIGTMFTQCYFYFFSSDSNLMLNYIKTFSFLPSLRTPLSTVINGKSSIFHTQIEIYSKFKYFRIECQSEFMPYIAFTFQFCTFINGK